MDKKKTITNKTSALPLDEWNLLLSQHQPYVNSFGETGTQIRINQFDLSNIEIKNTSLTDSFITESVFRNNRFENAVEYFRKCCRFEQTKENGEGRLPA